MHLSVVSGAPWKEVSASLCGLSSAAHHSGTVVPRHLLQGTGLCWHLRSPISVWLAASSYGMEREVIQYLFVELQLLAYLKLCKSVVPACRRIGKILELTSQDLSPENPRS